MVRAASPGWAASGWLPGQLLCQLEAARSCWQVGRQRGSPSVPCSCLHADVGLTLTHPLLPRCPLPPPGHCAQVHPAQLAERVPALVPRHQGCQVPRQPRGAGAHSLLVWVVCWCAGHASTELVWWLESSSLSVRCLSTAPALPCTLCSCVALLLVLAGNPQEYQKAEIAAPGKFDVLVTSYEMVIKASRMPIRHCSSRSQSWSHRPRPVQQPAPHAPLPLPLPASLSTGEKPLAQVPLALHHHRRGAPHQERELAPVAGTHYAVCSCLVLRVAQLHTGF